MKQTFKAIDAQTIAAIASEFMTDKRYTAWYDKNCDEFEGTAGIWQALANVSLEIIAAEHKLRVVGFQWWNFNFMEAVFAIVDHLYNHGFDADWVAVLLSIAEQQVQQGVATTEGSDDA